MKTESLCPCGRNKSYQKCCGLVHSNIQKAITCEDLMRSRYTAFTKGMGDYLMQSHHTSTRLISEKQEIVKWAKSVEWNRLEIINTTNETVEFKAYFYTSNLGVKKLEYIHENSKFIKENGHWTYLEALDFN